MASTGTYAGHGGELAVELDPVGDPGTFTVFPKVQDLEWPQLGSPLIPSSGQEDGGDEFVQANYLSVGSVDVTAWFKPADASHDEAEGVYNQLDEREKRGFKWTGPGGAGDVLIGSGYATNISRMAPKADGGMYEMNFTIQLEVPILINAVTLGDGT